MSRSKHYVVLVDEQDQNIGFMEKIEAHEAGELHRAFSVFIFNNANQLLLQKRASHKYHTGDLWTNTCCSHPLPGEKPADAASRRLKEEMGMTTAKPLVHKFEFTYRHQFDNGLIEHEYDHVFFGRSDSLPSINPDEVADYRYMSMDELRDDLKNNPNHYTPWLHHCFDKVYEFWEKELITQEAS